MIDESALISLVAVSSRVVIGAAVADGVDGVGTDAGDGEIVLCVVPGAVRLGPGSEETWVKGFGGSSGVSYFGLQALLRGRPNSLYTPRRSPEQVDQAG